MSATHQEPRRKVKRSKAESIRDAILRGFVDPSTFSNPVLLDDRAKELSAVQLSALVQGLSVRIRSASTGVKVPRHRGPGPGEYVVPLRHAETAPRWAPDIAVFSEVDRAAKVLPGPCAYAPEKPSSARSTRMASRLPDRLVKPTPGPGMYNPRPPLSSKRFEIPPVTDVVGDELLTIRPGPCQYNAPSLFDPKPWNAAQHSPRWQTPLFRTPGPGRYSVPSMMPAQTAFSETRQQFH